MRKLAFYTLLAILFVGCNESPKTSDKAAIADDGIESFAVLETLDAPPYIYILGDQEGTKRWFAISAQEVKTGDVLFYDNPLVMKDFYSKELERPFDEVVFLSRVEDNAEAFSKTVGRIENKPSGKITTDQLELSIEVPANAISIAQLYEGKEKYNGKKVMVKGQVVKFSPEIMNTNWIHIQDGTTFDSKYDLTITSNEVVAVGDIITFEGVVAVDKDFGYGYFYELILEAAVTAK